MEKKAFIVIPFGSNNALKFYTPIMKDLETDYKIYLIKTNYQPPQTT